MDSQVISWIVSLVAGSVGGNVAGTLLKDRNLGPVINSVLGLIGGGIGGFVLPSLAAVQGVVGAEPSDIVKGGLSAVVGALLPVIVSFFKKPATAA